MTHIDTADEALYRALPAASNVLEIGCGKGELGARYKREHPRTKWTGADAEREDVKQARALLDKAIVLDRAAQDMQGSEPFDLIVLNGTAEFLDQPGLLLSRLRVRNPQARLVCRTANLSHLSVLEKLLMGDTALPGGQDKRPFFSQSAFFKLLLDAGWLPHLSHAVNDASANEEMLKALLLPARLLGVPENTARRFYAMREMIVSCTQAERTAQEAPAAARISVVVPMNNPLQFSLNIACSPGLKEVGAQVITVAGASSAADAFEKGLAQAANDWIIFAHQDVYFPAGSGHALLSRLARVPAADATSELFGFFGLAMGPQNTIRQAGLVIDRMACLDLAESDACISLDEFAVVLHRRTRLRLDASLGWHTWATDLCLQSCLRAEPKQFAKVVRVPVYHNSFNDFQLPQSFHESAVKLLAKYPELHAIPTLCGNLTRTAPLPVSSALKGP